MDALRPAGGASSDKYHSLGGKILHDMKYYDRVYTD